MRQPTRLPIYTSQGEDAALSTAGTVFSEVGRAEELSPLDPDVAHHKSFADGMRSMTSSMVPAGAAGGAVARGRRDAGRLERLGWSSSPPVPANSQAPGTLLSTAVLSNSGDLEASRGSGIVEGVKGYMVEGSVAPDSGVQGNGNPRNSSDFRSSAAPQLFDRMPNRGSALSATLDAVLEEGEVWEKGPELMWVTAWPTVNGVDLVHGFIGGIVASPSLPSPYYPVPRSSWPISLRSNAMCKV